MNQINYSKKNFFLFNLASIVYEKNFKDMDLKDFCD